MSDAYLVGKCAVVQMNCNDGNIDKNTKSISDMIRRIHQEDSDVRMIVFPEMILYGYCMFDEILKRYTQEDINRALKELSEVSNECQVDIVVGTPKIEGDFVENALYYICPKYGFKHVYSKVHMISEEAPYLSSSNTFSVCDTVLGKTGFLICWDSAFAEVSRVYRKMDVEALIVCAAWEREHEWQWKIAIAARSLDNSIPILASNRVGANEEVTFAGHAMVTDCMGNVLSEADGEKDDYITVNIAQLKDKSMLKGFGSPYAELREEIYCVDNVKVKD